ncbi:MAG: tRNA (guanosine(37)-N1)-methyltransferase TrmD [Candidatus Izemoplasmatales bacterium]|nr:tRNA (guanosine(37)-N1)-methyltransferase TrmD [Candidatus Izemoplasmatales bacterium]MDD4068921.1 tRNA (guanosine(37)-N1)-methyltransferase TrmD [Candidatus Izemoplasmatales bacterium]
MKITILSLFPEMINPIFNASILKRALEKELIEFEIINFRDFSTNKHKTVDDTPYGGGSGMVLSVEPIYFALESINTKSHKILLTPQGSTFNQKKAKDLVEFDHLVFICGHYEGFDERVREFVDEELSLGDFVMTGGEIAAIAMVDAIVRLIPGVLGSKESYENDSFFNDYLDFPQYTKPRDFMGHKVPDVLVSGDHEKIAKWRKEMQEKKTLERRPDLLKK